MGLALISLFPAWPAISLAIVVLYISYALAFRRLHLPPGPKGWPVIGNVIQLIAGGEHLELVFRDWAKIFGDIVYLRVFNREIVVLNKFSVARDLLEKRSSIYSDRPPFVLLNMMGWQDVTPLVPYGPQFRKHRRFIQQTFNQDASRAFHASQERETLVLLDNLVQAPDKFIKHFKTFSAATIFPIIYGRPVTSVDDELVKLVDAALLLTLQSGSPAAALADFFPILRHIPLWAPFSGFKHKALQVRKIVLELMNIPFEMVKMDMLSGEARPSFTSTLIERYCDPEKPTYDSENERAIKGSAAVLYAGADDTTTTVMETFVFAMVSHPEVFQKAQAEIDEVIGSRRLPNLSDRPSLPYLECVLKEMLRWNPPVPLNLPHRVTVNDVYQGYFIPEGATIVANVFAMLHDCEHPDEFIPERYIKEINLPDSRKVAFGFGRRMCPGRHFALSSVWCMMANMIAALIIERTPEDRAANVSPALQVAAGFVRHPKSFSCVIRPRSERAMALIREARNFAGI